MGGGETSAPQLPMGLPLPALQGSQTSPPPHSKQCNWVSGLPSWGGGGHATGHVIAEGAYLPPGFSSQEQQQQQTGAAANALKAEAKPRPLTHVAASPPANRKRLPLRTAPYPPILFQAAARGAGARELEKID